MLWTMHWTTFYGLLVPVLVQAHPREIEVKGDLIL